MSATTELAIHPLADLIPAMSDESFAELREDIAAHGLRQPIVLFEQMVLDGRHRLRACEETSTEPHFEEYTGEEPAAHVLSLNLHRRHLSVSQRAMIATDFLPHLKEEARARMAAGGAKAAPGRPSDRKGASNEAPFGLSPAHHGRAAREAGQMVGVSRAVVERAKRVAENDPELAQRVREGGLTVNAANEMVKPPRKVAEAPGENGRFASGRSIQRIAAQAASLDMAIGAIPLVKSCSRLDADECADALEKCKKGRKAITALVNALLAASERQ